MLVDPVRSAALLGLLAVTDENDRLRRSHYQPFSFSSSSTEVLKNFTPNAIAPAMSREAMAMPATIFMSRTLRSASPIRGYSDAVPELPPQTTVSSTGRTAFGFTALLAAFALALNFVITALGVYAELPSSSKTAPTIYGYANGEGLSGAIGRLLDFVSYFTILSNVIVVIVLFALWRGRIRPTSRWRALRLDSVLMITITGLIFAILLAPDAQLQGLQYVTNTIEHYITPVLTVLTFLIWGPRRWFRLSTVPAALVIPLAWVAYSLIRGAVIDAYPYGFLDVAAYGYGTVFLNVLGILVFGIVLALAFVGLDKLLSRHSPA